MKLLIIGGGTGGISMAARMRKHLGPGEITLIEPSSDHYYQPLWTLVGGGICQKEESRRDLADFVPEGVDWIRSTVSEMRPDKNEVQLANGQICNYEYLILASGLIPDFSQIRGVDGHLGSNGLCSIYGSADHAEKTSKMIESFKGGKALFVMPRTPIKCAGAPQKIMYLAEEIFRDKGIRDQTEVHYFGTGAGIFGVPVFAASLNKIVAERGIKTHFLHQLVEVKAEEKVAVFEILPVPEKAAHSPEEVFPKIEVKYDLLHIVPPCRAHDFVSQSKLANHEGPQKGWMKVDFHTLQNPDFPNVFGIGDVTGVPNSKTGAAIRKQAPVIEANLLQVLKGQKATHQYDGYSSCPLVTRKGRVILAEFGYDSKLLPTFPFDQSQESWSMWILKRHILPRMYWHGMLRGHL